MYMHEYIFSSQVINHSADCLIPVIVQIQAKNTIYWWLKTGT